MSDSNKVKLGKIGEKLIAKYFNIPENVDHYDKAKDLIMYDGKTIEVKTQNRYPQKNVFSFRAPSPGDDSRTALNGLNNVLKCMSVDRLIFVEYDNSDIIRAYECVDRKTYILYTTSKPLNMIGFPIGKMQLLFEFEDASLAKEMRSLSQSSYIKKD